MCYGIPLGVYQGVRSLNLIIYDHRHDHRPSHPYYAGTEDVGFSPTRQTLHAPSEKHRGVFGESREG